MNTRKFLVAAIAFITAVSVIGCSDKEDTNESDGGVIEAIAPQSVIFQWQPLYEDKLTEFMNSGRYSDSSRFDLHDINSDGNPELIISPSEEAASMCEIYTIAQGNIERLGDTGSNGEITYIPFNDIFVYEYKGDGFVHGEYMQLENGTFNTVLDYYNNSAAASRGATISYEINGSEVTLQQYRETLAQYGGENSIRLGRKYTFGAEAIDYALHYSESWGAVLTEKQKELYRKRLSDTLASDPESNAAFELCDLDGNDIPELIVSLGYDEESACTVCWIQDGEISEMDGSFGVKGQFSFDTAQKILFYPDMYGDLMFRSLTGDDIGSFEKSDSVMECGRKFVLSDENIIAAFR